MQASCVRIVADWLKDDTNGVDPMLLLVPLDGTDPRPAAITDARILDDTRHPAVTRIHQSQGELPRELWAAGSTVVVFSPAVRFDDGIVSQDAPIKAEVDLTVGIIVPNAVTETAARDLGYYERAVRKSIRRLELNTNADLRLRNEIQLVRVLRKGVGGFGGVADDKGVTKAVTLTWTARDNAP